MTQQVETAVPAERQAAPGFLAALDVVFAARCFAAFDAAGNGPKLPPLRSDCTAVNHRAVGFAGRALLTPVGLAR